MTGIGTELKIDLVGNFFQKMGNVKSTIDSLDKGIDVKINTSNTQIKATTESLKGVKQGIKGVNSDIIHVPTDDSSLQKLNKSVGDIDVNLKDSIDSAKEFAKEMMALALVLATTFIAPISAAREYEDAMLSIGRSLDMHGQEDKFLKRLMLIKGGTVKELSEISTIIAKGGVKDLEEVIKMTEEINKVSKAIDLPAGPATEALSKFITLNDRMFDSKNVMDVADKVTNVENVVSNVNASGLLEIMKRNAVFGKQMGLDSDSQIAIASALMKRGVSPEKDATAFESFANRISTVDEKLGTDYAGMIKTKGIEGFKTVISELSKLSAGQKKDVLGSEAQKLVLKLGDEKGVQDIDKILKTIKNSEGAVDEEFKKYEATFTASFEELKKKVKNLFASFGQVLLVDLTPIVKGISKFLEITRVIADRFPMLKRVILYSALAFVTLGPAIRLVTFAFGTLGPAIRLVRFAFMGLGSVLAFTGKMFTVLRLGPVVNTMMTLGATILRTTGILKVFRFVFATAFLGPAFIIVGALYLIISNFRSFAEALRKIYNSIIAPVFEFFRNLFLDLSTFATKSLNSVLIGFYSLFGGLAKKFPKMTAFIGLDSSEMDKKVAKLRSESIELEKQNELDKEISMRVSKEGLEDMKAYQKMAKVQDGLNDFTKGVGEKVMGVVNNMFGSVPEEDNRLITPKGNTKADEDNLIKKLDKTYSKPMKVEVELRERGFIKKFVDSWESGKKEIIYEAEERDTLIPFYHPAS